MYPKTWFPEQESNLQRPVISRLLYHLIIRENLVDLDRIELLAATPLINGYQVTAGNGEQDP